MADTPAKLRRRWTFSLRTLVAVMLVAGPLLGWHFRREYDRRHPVEVALRWLRQHAAQQSGSWTLGQHDTSAYGNTAASVGGLAFLAEASQDPSAADNAPPEDSPAPPSNPP